MAKNLITTVFQLNDNLRIDENSKGDNKGKQQERRHRRRRLRQRDQRRGTQQPEPERHPVPGSGGDRPDGDRFDRHDQDHRQR